jgi:hypothetical protein
MLRCPQCGTPVQATWDWCHHCGLDPEGLKPPDWQPAEPPASDAAEPAPAQPVEPVERPAPASVPPPAIAVPVGPSGQPVGPSGYDPPAYVGPSVASSGTSSKTPIVLAVVGVVFVVLVAVVGGAVALFGRSSSTTSPSGKNGASGGSTPTTLAPFVWEPFDPPDHSFAIDMPGTAESRPIQVTGYQGGHLYVASVPGGPDFHLAHFDLDNTQYVADPGRYVRLFTEGYAVANNGKLLLNEVGDFAAMTSSRFIATYPNGHRGQGIVFVGGDRIYVIAIETPGGEPADTAMFERYLNSFHIN